MEAVIRAGIRRFTDETGRLWCALADYFIRSGLFEKARDVYEEGIATVMTVRDFSIVFDAYALYEETMLSAKIELRNDQEADGAAAGSDEFDETSDDIDLRLARLERLMDQRPRLLSLVLLRQNPHNVHEWHKRVKVHRLDSAPPPAHTHTPCLCSLSPHPQLFEDAASKVRVYMEAVKTVDYTKAVGKPHSLWVSFAKLYEAEGVLEEARVVFKKVQCMPCHLRAAVHPRLLGCAV